MDVSGYRLLSSAQVPPNKALPLGLVVMPHETRMLLDPAAADAFIAGYKQVLLCVAGDDNDRVADRGMLETGSRTTSGKAESGAP